jgi:hypothetical protein
LKCLEGVRSLKERGSFRRGAFLVEAGLVIEL